MMIVRHRRYTPETELAYYLGGNDGLAARLRKCTLDSVERERWITHAAHDHGFFVVRQGDLSIRE